MRRELIVQQLILVAIVLVACGTASAHERESFNNDTLVAMLEQVNQHYFAGQLKDVEVRWANLKSEDDRGITRSYGSGSFLIEIDRDTNKTSRIAQVALNHEACHVATYVQIEQEHSDLHGRLFRNCMRRFSFTKSALGSAFAVAWASLRIITNETRPGR
jgi:hypothetical protein